MKDGEAKGDKGLTQLAAGHYVSRGWSVIPVPHRSKTPGLRG
jgi:hypothetical protein